MSQSSYAARLQQSPQEKDQEELQFRVEETQQQLASEKTATKRDLSKARKDLNTAKGTYPLNTKTISALVADVEGFEKGLALIEELEAELFPAEEPKKAAKK